MNQVFNLYRDYGALLNALTIFGLFFLGVLELWLRALSPTASRILEIGWGATGLGFIALMTLSPVSDGDTPGFVSLEIHNLVNELTSPASTTFHWPDWHDPIGNIMMTVPLACVMTLSISARKTIFLILLLAAGIEITQYFYGHGRTSQFSDIALNTFGGCVGVILANLSRGFFNKFWQTKVSA